MYFSSVLICCRSNGSPRRHPPVWSNVGAHETPTAHRLVLLGYHWSLKFSDVGLLVRCGNTAPTPVGLELPLLKKWTLARVPTTGGGFDPPVLCDPRRLVFGQVRVDLAHLYR